MAEIDRDAQPHTWAPGPPERPRTLDPRLPPDARVAPTAALTVLWLAFLSASRAREPTAAFPVQPVLPRPARIPTSVLCAPLGVALLRVLGLLYSPGIGLL